MASDMKKTSRKAGKVTKTTKSISRKKADVVAVTNRNFFELYGEDVGATSLIGDILKFSKGGKFLVGRSEKELPEGTKLVADFNLFRVGWVKWVNQRPLKTHMGLIVEGFNPGPRKPLGDNDETLWEKFSDGKSKDPWQFSNELVLFNPANPDEKYTFVTSSNGGRTALRALSAEYGLHIRHAADELPLVELMVGAYTHKNKTYGKIKIPVFAITGWVDAPKKQKRSKKTAAKALSNGKTKAKTVKKAMVVKPVKEPSLPVHSKRSDDADSHLFE
jgi:hypothetical protein